MCYYKGLDIPCDLIINYDQLSRIEDQITVALHFSKRILEINCSRAVGVAQLHYQSPLFFPLFLLYHCQHVVFLSLDLYLIMLR